MKINQKLKVLDMDFYGWVWKLHSKHIRNKLCCIPNEEALTVYYTKRFIKAKIILEVFPNFIFRKIIIRLLDIEVQKW